MGGVEIVCHLYIAFWLVESTFFCYHYSLSLTMSFYVILIDLRFILITIFIISVIPCTIPLSYPFEEEEEDEITRRRNKPKKVMRGCQPKSSRLQK